MKWVNYIASALQVLALLGRAFSGWKNRRLGRIETEHAQSERDLASLREAADARRAAGRDTGGMRRDPHNRDAH